MNINLNELNYQDICKIIKDANDTLNNNKNLFYENIKSKNFKKIEIYKNKISLDSILETFKKGFPMYSYEDMKIIKNIFSQEIKNNQNIKDLISYHLIKNGLWHYKYILDFYQNKDINITNSLKLEIKNSIIKQINDGSLTNICAIEKLINYQENKNDIIYQINQEEIFNLFMDKYFKDDQNSKEEQVLKAIESENNRLTKYLITKWGVSFLYNEENKKYNQIYSSLYSKNKEICINLKKYIIDNIEDLTVCNHMFLTTTLRNIDKNMSHEEELLKLSIYILSKYNENQLKEAKILIENKNKKDPYKFKRYNYLVGLMDFLQLEVQENNKKRKSFKI